MNGSASSGEEVTIITGDVANSTTSFADVTGLSFSVTSGKIYHFRAMILFSAALLGTGARFAMSGPASPTVYANSYTVASGATSAATGNAAAYDVATASTNSASTNGNLAIVEGFVRPSSSGTMIVRFASEVGSSAITVLAGSWLRYRQLD
jgi:hypothetical protein